MRRRVLFTALASVPLCGCHCTRVLWAQPPAVATSLRAEYVVDLAGPDARGDGLLVHGALRSGAVAGPWVDRCGGDVWLHLRTSEDGELVRTLLADPAAFGLQAATVALVLPVDAAGGEPSIDLEIMGAPAAIGVLAAASPAEPDAGGGFGPSASAGEVDARRDQAMRSCARDLARADWSGAAPRIAGVDATRPVRWLGSDGAGVAAAFVAADGSRLGAALAVDATAGSWDEARAAVAGMVVELPCRTADGPAVLRLDAERAWVLARAFGGCHGPAVLRTRWHGEPSRMRPEVGAPRPLRQPWQLVVQSSELAAAGGHGLGGTTVRVVATPFAVAADAVWGLFAAVTGTIDDGPGSGP